MSQAISPATSRAYGLARVARVWHLSRATVYRHRAAPDPAAPTGPTRCGPVGACSDAELVGHIRAEIPGSRLHGEGYRKIWARPDRRPRAALTAWPGSPGSGISPGPRSIAIARRPTLRHQPARHAAARSAPAPMPSWSGTSAPRSPARACTARVIGRSGPGQIAGHEPRLRPGQGRPGLASLPGHGLSPSRGARPCGTNRPDTLRPGRRLLRCRVGRAHPRRDPRLAPARRGLSEDLGPAAPCRHAHLGPAGPPPGRPTRPARYPPGPPAGSLRALS